MVRQGPLGWREVALLTWTDFGLFLFGCLVILLDPLRRLALWKK